MSVFKQDFSKKTQKKSNTIYWSKERQLILPDYNHYIKTSIIQKNGTNIMVLIPDRFTLSKCPILTPITHFQFTLIGLYFSM